MSRINFVLSWVEYEKCFITSEPGYANDYQRVTDKFWTKSLILVDALQGQATLFFVLIKIRQPGQNSDPWGQGHQNVPTSVYEPNEAHM